MTPALRAAYRVRSVRLKLPKRRDDTTPVGRAPAV
jgi:hypothetical protein